MSAEFETIAALLLKLSADELAEVRARAGILIQAGGRPQRTSRAASAGPLPEALAETDIELVLGEIAGHLVSEGLEFASVPMLKRTTNYRSFAEKVPATLTFMRQATQNRNKLRALIRMSVRLLQADMHKMAVPVSVRTLMNHWHRVPAVINNNFPGYAQAGLLRLLVQSAEANPRYVQESEIGDE